MDAAVRRVLHPNWMPNPESWAWEGPHGRQGLGPTWREHVGQHNLQWLALGMTDPPRLYNARENPLFMWVLMQGGRLAEQAELLTLQQFATRTPQSTWHAQLCVRARQRLAHANA